MEFLQHILGAAGADTLHAFTVVPGFGAYFRGVGSVAECGSGRIVVASGGVSLTVTGEGLSVGRYFQGDLFISGRIGEVRIE